MHNSTHQCFCLVEKFYTPYVTHLLYVICRNHYSGLWIANNRWQTLELRAGSVRGSRSLTRDDGSLIHRISDLAEFKRWLLIVLLTILYDKLQSSYMRNVFHF